MGKTLSIVGVATLLFVGACGFMNEMHELGESAQRTFFEAVSSDDPARLYDLLDPELQDLVDPEVLGVWMAALNENLGSFQKLSKAKWNVNASTQDGKKVLDVSGTAVFEKGDAQSDFRFLAGKVVKFEVKSAKVPDPWLTGIPDTSRYVAEGKACIEKLLSGDVDGGLALMHENLQSQLPRDRLEQGMNALAAQIGGLVSVTPVSDVFEGGDEPALVIRYVVNGKQGEVGGKLVYKFSPWKGALLAIDVPE